MIPIPPTINETEAIAPRRMLITVDVELAAVAISTWLLIVKSSSCPGRNSMTLP